MSTLKEEREAIVDMIDDIMAKYHMGEHMYSPEREYERRENFRLEDETTYERAEREAMMADEVQADYEREDKMGMI